MELYTFASKTSSHFTKTQTLIPKTSLRITEKTTIFRIHAIIRVSAQTSGGEIMLLTINADTLRNSFLFKDVDQSILEQVAKHCQAMELHAGETLFEQDSVSDALYFLESGQIHVVRHYPEGYEVVIATEVPYYVIGELSLLANQPRTGSVVAVGDCDLIKLSRASILEICEKIPEISLKATSHLGKRLYRLNLRVRESAIGNIAARIASVLLLLAENQDTNDFSSVAVTRLARATAINPDAVERLLKQWSDYEIISQNGQKITIHNLETLRNLAG
jgi:CRP/FNR family transcriptional regulator